MLVIILGLGYGGHQVGTLPGFSSGAGQYEMKRTESIYCGSKSLYSPSPSSPIPTRAAINRSESFHHSKPPNNTLYTLRHQQPPPLHRSKSMYSTENGLTDPIYSPKSVAGDVFFSPKSECGESIYSPKSVGDPTSIYSQQMGVFKRRDEFTKSVSRGVDNDRHPSLGDTHSRHTNLGDAAQSRSTSQGDAAHSRKTSLGDGHDYINMKSPITIGDMCGAGDKYSKQESVDSSYGSYVSAPQHQFYNKNSGPPSYSKKYNHPDNKTSNFNILKQNSINVQRSKNHVY